MTSRKLIICLFTSMVMLSSLLLKMGYIPFLHGVPCVSGCDISDG